MNILQTLLLMAYLYAGLHMFLAIGHIWIKYTFRVDTENILCKIQRYKYGEYNINPNRDTMLSAVIFLIMESFVVLIVAGIVGRVALDHGVESLITVLSVIFIPIIIVFVPRYVVDILRSLKYNNKTGDSDRLLALEAEIEKLKGKNNGK